MADVMQKAISANNIKAGTVVIKTGIKNVQVFDGNNQDHTEPTAAQVEAKYDNRFTHGDFKSA